ncbi:peptidase C45 acyl-coenzyme A:6-aminopenicillanic acid acyl-transferase [Xylogone sp. PMI_703]|nr:peptidase C45 acyl-coenzyme A:6-aminopenicillanic acid acyl-transferase [Xylogone sp. PMI_703]
MTVVTVTPSVTGSSNTTASSYTSTYQHIVVSGSAYERGYQHGVQAASKVIFNINYYNVRSSDMPPADVRTFYIEQVYLPAITQYWQEGLEEMQGIADGAGVELADVVLLNSRYDLSRVARQMAKDKIADDNKFPSEVGASITAGVDVVIPPLPRVFIAQNWDMSAWLLENDTIIILESHDPEGDDVVRPRKVITLTEAGQLARSGMNSTGLALCANSLWSSQDLGSLHIQEKNVGAVAKVSKPIKQKPYLPISLSRRMFLGCGIMSAGLRSLYNAPYHMSSNIVIGSRDGLAMDLEMTPKQHFILYPSVVAQSKGYRTEMVTHANHFVSPAFVSRDHIHCTYGGGSSLFRDIRLRTLLEIRAEQKLQLFTDMENALLGVEDLKAAFSDHASYPNSLCEHQTQENRRKNGFYGQPERSTVTVACVVYDVANQEMHVCKGNPCIGRWVTYTL